MQTCIIACIFRISPLVNLHLPSSLAMHPNCVLAQQNGFIMNDSAKKANVSCEGFLVPVLFKFSPLKTAKKGSFVARPASKQMCWEPLLREALPEARGPHKARFMARSLPRCRPALLPSFVAGLCHRWNGFRLPLSISLDYAVRLLFPARWGVVGNLQKSRTRYDGGDGRNQVPSCAAVGGEGLTALFVCRAGAVADAFCWVTLTGFVLLALLSALLC